MKTTQIAILGIVLATFLIGLAFYPRLPDRTASHWNARGDVDGTMPRLWGAFFLPILLLGLALLLILIPRIDPLRANIEAFRPTYDRFILVFLAFMVIVYLQTLLWNVGVKISPVVVMPIGVGLLFYYSGVLMEKAKRNWFIGIRTPWTLSSDRVWDKTHRLGARLFRAAGVLALVGVFFPAHVFLFVVVPVLLATLYLTVYSYLEYRREVI